MPSKSPNFPSSAARVVAWSLALSAGGIFASSPNDAPDFLREVRPILSSRCFKCHGPDEKTRKGKLRLDVREEAMKPAKSGAVAIVPSHPDKSSMVGRIDSSDPDEIMPPPASKISLTEAERAILRRWISAGAEYRPHWAFLPPEQQPPPQTKFPAANPIDNFLFARLEKEGLEPSPRADKLTLARRVALDLTGLPPAVEDSDRFADDPDPGAYAKYVDRLLDSPQYGERWARRWLDLARYADTNGYEKDRARTIWPYRDWVIKALNADMPFDQFTVEQIAGDMLPGATLDQKVATGFHRNTMLNEEGGIDPLEFRFYAMVDRVHTTATAWLGMTFACAQCHTHKYDPIQQKEYYQFMAFLDNCEEPPLDLVTPEIEARRREIGAKTAALERALPDKFPPASASNWIRPKILSAAAQSGVPLQAQDDGSVAAGGEAAAIDTYTLTLEAPGGRTLTGIRLEALVDPRNPRAGPGRTSHGNFVLTEIGVQPENGPGAAAAQKIVLTNVKADAEQNGFPAAAAVDGDSGSGWAVDVAGGGQPIHTNRTWTADFASPVVLPAGKLKVTLEQNYGSRHLLGRMRLSLAAADATPASSPAQHLERKFAAWLEDQRRAAVAWEILRPAEMKTNLPLLTLEADGSVFASGDQTKSDTYELSFRSALRNVTALRLEALPDDRLPDHGPGRTYYEGPIGDFTLCNITVQSAGNPVAIASALASFSAGGFGAEKALDDNMQTGWSINGGQGRRHVAVFRFASPLAHAGDLKLKMLFERHYSSGLGRFRISATTSMNPAQPSDMPEETLRLLTIPDNQLTAEQRHVLLQEFCRQAAELAGARKEIDALRNSVPKPVTSLVMSERPADNPRQTFVHNRGEFLQPTDLVSADLPTLFKLPGVTAPRNRLEFARWLVSPRNPLTARVVVNRHWQAFFGRGLVRTMEDFGFQGEAPSHPELLDWLAVEFMKQGWSMKKLHRLIVTSAAYQQASAAGESLRLKDPLNILLARGPRFRVEAEMVRDSMLQASGLLSPKIGGPSVFPPQPAGVTTEGAYGALSWNVSTGEDRHRRALYTYTKRTTPYAMLAAFDGPSGEACAAKRDVSNTPLQSLTVLNDVVVMESAQALAAAAAARKDATDAQKLADIFRRCLTRPPAQEETAPLLEFLGRLRQRIAGGEIKAAELAGAGEGPAEERAAWTAVARVILNLEEMITKR